jgi:hypothetical protein
MRSPDAISRRIRQRNVIKFSENFEKKVRWRPWQWLDSMSCTREVQTHRDRKMQDRWRAKSRKCSSISFPWRGFSTKYSSWQDTQSVPHPTVTFTATTRKSTKTSPRTLATKELAVASWQPSHSSFISGNFLPKTRWLSSPSRSTFLCFPNEIKTERPPSWHTWGHRVLRLCCRLRAALL